MKTIIYDSLLSTVLLILIPVLLQWGLYIWAKRTEYVYPAWAGTTGIFAYIGVALYLIVKYSISYGSLPILLMFAILIVIAMIDFKHQLIPNRLNLALFILSLIVVIRNIEFWKMHLLGGLILLGVFVLFFFISFGSLGMGDVKLSIPIGIIITGSGIIKFLMITFVSGALVSILLLLLKIRKRDDKIAFGPYMVLAFFCHFLF